MSHKAPKYCGSCWYSLKQRCWVWERKGQWRAQWEPRECSKRAGGAAGRLSLRLEDWVGSGSGGWWPGSVHLEALNSSVQVYIEAVEGDTVWNETRCS